MKINPKTKLNSSSINKSSLIIVNNSKDKNYKTLQSKQINSKMKSIRDKCVKIMTSKDKLTLIKTSLKKLSKLLNHSISPQSSFRILKKISMTSILIFKK